MREIESLIMPTIDQLGYELVRVQMQGSRRPTLQIMAERRDRRGMTVDDCARISREVSALLDQRDPIDGEYVLEVSSPGIDRPLTRPEDYDRFINHEAKIELAWPVEGRKRFKGLLGARDGDSVTVIEETGPAQVPLGAVKSAKLVLTDELIAAVREEEQQAASEPTDAPQP